MHGIDKALSCVSGKAIRQFGPILVGGDRFNPRDDFVRNQASIGLYVDIGMSWEI